MPPSNYSSWMMMTVLGTWEGESHYRQDNILQFLVIVALKVVLNLWILTFCFRSLQRSLIGISAISVFLADIILLFGVTTAWVLRQRINTFVSMCFILSHASTIYAILPLPILLLGLLDHVGQLQICSHPMSSRRALMSCILILLLWVLACFYSYCYTNTDVVGVRYNFSVLCPVQDSTVVIYFCAGLSIAIVCVVLLFCQAVPLWLRANLKHSSMQHIQVMSQSDLLYTKLQEQQDDEQGLAPVKPVLQQCPPLLLSITLGFASNWAPFLVINTACWLLDFNAPSYISFSMLWLLCANSLLVGMVFWSRPERTGLCTVLEDETCDWRLYWQHSIQKQHPGGIFTM